MNQTENTITMALAKKFCPPAFGFLSQVGNGTGGNKSRTADGIAMSLWPSRGLELYGFEIKISRGDVKKELENPAKSEAFMRYCHYWYLVLSDPKLIQPGELPKTWGLMTVNGRGVKTLVAAPELRANQISYPFLAGLFRRISEESFSVGQNQLRKEFDRGFRAGEERPKNNFNLLTERLRAFEEKSGITIDRYNGASIGEAVKTVMAGGVKNQVQRFEYIVQNAEEFARASRESLNRMKENTNESKD